MFFKKRFDKKAQISDFVLTVIVDLIIVLFFTTVLYIFIIDSANDVRFQKQFLARDVSLMLSVAYASPYEAVIDYSSSNPIFSYVPGTSGVFEIPGFAYDFMDPYRVDVYTHEGSHDEKEQNLREQGVFDFPDIIGRQTEYTKGTYHVAGDKYVLAKKTIIERDMFDIFKDKARLRVE
jgi:hypothetical protein